jgi:mono/diheme cytochrome c family protein
VLLAPAFLLISYEVIAVDFTVLMENQPAIEYHDGPHLLPPDEAVPVSRPAYKDIGVPENPVPADAVSVQRGGTLFSIHCALCHNHDARGEGPISDYWGEDRRKPPDLTEARIASMTDGAIYGFIGNGIGAMPPLRENIGERERWDVINYLRSLQ